MATLENDLFIRDETNAPGIDIRNTVGLDLLTNLKIN